MKINLGVLLMVVGFLTGCASAPFIVVEQVPSAPSFTIIPYDGDTDFSRQIERDILLLTSKVVERPELKYISTDARRTESSTVGASRAYGDGAIGASSGESVTASLYKIDVVAMYPEAKSDYIVVTYSKSKEIRVLQKDGLKLVASGLYDSVAFVRMSDFVAFVLGNANLLGNKTIKKECQPITK